MVIGIKSILQALKSKFAKSIMIPIISIFVVLLASIILIVFASFSNEIKANTMEKKLQQLYTTEQNISARIREINSITHSISEDSRFSFTKLEDNPSYSGYELAKVLKTFLIGNDFVSYLSYYRTSEADRVFTSVGDMLFRTFWKGYIHHSDVTEEEYLAQVRNIKNRKILPLKDSGSKRGYLTMIYPMPLYHSTPSAYVIVYINASKIDDISNSLFVESEGELTIFDLENQPIYHYASSQNEEERNEMVKAASLMLDGVSYEKITIDGEDYIIFQHKSDYNGWTYVSLIRRNDITSRLTDKQLTFILLLLYIILGAIAAIFISVLFNYRSINRLAQTISKDLDIGDENTSNEQLLLSDAYIYLREKTQNIAQNQFLSNLIEGQYDKFSIDFASNECNLYFEYSGYIACALYMEKLSDKKEIENRIGLIREHFAMYDMQCYPLYQMNPNRITIVLNAEEDMLSWDALQPIFFALHQEFIREYNQTVSMGLGNWYLDVLKVSNSVHEAISAMYVCVLEGKQFIKQYNDVDTEYITGMFSSITSRLVSGVRKGEVENIYNLIHELRGIFQNHRVAVQNQNVIAYHILTSLMEYAEDPVISERINVALGNILKHAQYNNLVMFHEIEQLCITITQQRKEAKVSNRNTDLVNTIKQAIEENLCDSMMSLESLSDICGISPSYLSRCFKSQMECTPMNYVDTLRMNLVKEKLRTTDLSLKQILPETGFVDQSNFIRKFKKVEGVTPMNYRKIHKVDS